MPMFSVLVTEHTWYELEADSAASAEATMKQHLQDGFPGGAIDYEYSIEASEADADILDHLENTAGDR